MKIHSKEKDYYDRAANLGVDAEQHYVRKQEVFEANLSLPMAGGRDISDIYFEVIGFCGQLFPLIRVVNRVFLNGEEHQGRFRDVSGIFFDYESFDQKYPEVKTAKYYYYDRKAKYEEFFSEFDFKSDELFLKHRAPIFLLAVDEENRRRDTGRGTGYMARLTTNIILKDYDFFRIKDTYTAFSEISQFLGNQLAFETAPEPLADRYKILAHGFDLKTSFRKEASEVKR